MVLTLFWRRPGILIRISEDQIKTKASSIIIITRIWSHTCHTHTKINCNIQRNTEQRLHYGIQPNSDFGRGSNESTILHEFQAPTVDIRTFLLRANCLPQRHREIGRIALVLWPEHALKFLHHIGERWGRGNTSWRQILWRLLRGSWIFVLWIVEGNKISGW